jgi:excisionase family DNA binding protein
VPNQHFSVLFPGGIPDMSAQKGSRILLDELLAMEDFQLVALPRDEIETLRASCQEMRVEEAHEAVEIQEYLTTTKAKWDPFAEGRKVVEGLKSLEGGAIERTEAARRLNVAIQTLHNWVENGRIVAWKDPAGRYRFPNWQFGADGILPGIRNCLAELDSGDQWAVMCFFLIPSHYLGGRRPLDLIREGHPEKAIELARSQPNHG